MIVQPDFCDHWKTQQLVSLTGDKASPLAVIRLWGHCQQRRAWIFPKMTARALAAVCRWNGNAARLLKVLQDCGFIRVKGNRVIVHQWQEYNASLVASWENGKRGGRPPKASTSPSPATAETQGFSAANPAPTRTKPIREDRSRPDTHTHKTPRLVEVKAKAADRGLSDDQAQAIFDFWEHREWCKDGKRVSLAYAVNTWTVKSPSRRSSPHKAGSTPSKKSPTVWELKQVLEAAEVELKKAGKGCPSQYASTEQHEAWKRSPGGRQYEKLRARRDGLRAKLAMAGG